MQPGRPSFELTRFVFLRLLGFLHVVAFLALIRQMRPLLGSHGLLPVGRFLTQVERFAGSRTDGFLVLPSLFWWRADDAFLAGVAWLGLLLAALLLCGITNAVLTA